MTGNNRTHLETLRRLAVVTLCVVLLAAPTAFAGPADDAKAAAKAGKWAKAADAWAQVLEKSPTNKEAAIGLTKAAIRAKLPDHFLTAEDSLRTLLEKNEKDVTLLVALGDICLATSGAKQDTLAKKSYDDEARQSYEKALRIDPKSDGAAGGLAQTYYQMADFANAIKTVDDFLALKPVSPTRALYWKGQTLYLQARDAFTAGGNKLTPQATDLFRKAQGAYQASAHVGGKKTDAQVWIQLAYASAYLGDIPTAGDAYRKAAELDPNNDAPIRGLQSLYTHTPDKYLSALAGLLEKNANHTWALWYLADNRYKAGDFKQARKLYERYAAASDNAGAGYYAAALAATQMNDADGAEKLHFKALAANPAHGQAAAAIQKRLMDAGAEQRARKSPDDAQKVIAEFAPLLKAAPDMAWIRNNLGFILREAYVGGARGGGEAKWRPILKAATEVYTEAADILGEWTHEKEQSYTWQQRYAEAQIISDTGLMYEFYPATRDDDTAEKYFNTALEYTEDGYRDAFDGMTRLLARQQRWQDLYDLAMACAEGLTTESGAPDESARSRAAGLAKKLLADGKAKDE